MPQLTQEQLEKLNGNSKTSELKRPKPPASQSPEQSENDTQIALQEAIGEEAALAQEVISANQQRGSSLAVRAKVAQFSSFAETNANLTKQMGGVIRQFNQAIDTATDAVEVQASEGTNFFSSISDCLSSPAFSLSGRSAHLLGESPSGNGSGKSNPS